MGFIKSITTLFIYYRCQHIFLMFRIFFDNFGTIVLLSLVNTIFNAFAVGIAIWLPSGPFLYGGVEFNLVHCLPVAVEPDAVFDTFDEIHVNNLLYMVVYAESTLNAITMYNIFDFMARLNVQRLLDGFDYAYASFGTASFGVALLAGCAIVVFFGALVAFTTKYTEKTHALEPIIVFAYSSFDFNIGNITTFSGLISWVYLCCIIWSEIFRT